jgi:hypothetical protein
MATQMLVGQYCELNAQVFDASGETIPNQDSKTTFVSGTPSVVALKRLPTGVYQAHAIAVGSSIITATDGAATANTTINVIAVQVPTTLAICIGTIENNPNG